MLRYHRFLYKEKLDALANPQKQVGRKEEIQATD